MVLKSIEVLIPTPDAAQEVLSVVLLLYYVIHISILLGMIKTCLERLKLSFLSNFTSILMHHLHLDLVKSKHLEVFLAVLVDLCAILVDNVAFVDSEEV